MGSGQRRRDLATYCRGAVQAAVPAARAMGNAPAGPEAEAGPEASARVRRVRRGKAIVSDNLLRIFNRPLPNRRVLCRCGVEVNKPPFDFDRDSDGRLIGVEVCRCGASLGIKLTEEERALVVEQGKLL